MLRVFILKGFLHTVKFFSASIKMILFLFFILLILFNKIIYEYMDWFAYVELSLHSRNKSPLIMLYDFYNVFLNSQC